MLVKKMELTVAEDILMALNEKPAEFLQNMRTFAAVKFFELGKLSLGKAAELAKMSKLDFGYYLVFGIWDLCFYLSLINLFV